MAKVYSRTQRIGDQIQRELAQMIPREVKDPRLGFVTITAVEVSRDVGHAKVFVTVMGENDVEKIQQNVRVLGVARIDHAKTLHVINGREAGQNFNIATVAGAAVKMHNPGRL